LILLGPRFLLADKSPGVVVMPGLFISVPERGSPEGEWLRQKRGRRKTVPP